MFEDHNMLEEYARRSLEGSDWRVGCLFFDESNNCITESYIRMPGFNALREGIEEAQAREIVVVLRTCLKSFDTIQGMTYPSDISRAQFNTIAPILEGARKKTKPRTVDLYDVFNGLMYVVKTGCQWRPLPKDYPHWNTVHSYFRIWSETPKEETESVLTRVLKKIGRHRAYERWQEMLNHHGHS